MKTLRLLVCSALVATVSVAGRAAYADEQEEQDEAKKPRVTSSIAIVQPPPVVVPPREKPFAREYLGVEGLVGGSLVLTEPADGGRMSSSGGMAYHAGAHFALSRRHSLGLSFDSAALGTSERQGSSVQVASDTRRLWLLGLEGRVFPVRWSNGRLFLGIFAGLAWESARQIAAIDGTSGTATAVAATTCTGRGDASFGLGLSGGFDYELGNDVSLLGRALLAGARLPDEPVESGGRCYLPSGGSPNMLSAQLGISVRFDLSGAAAPPPKARETE